MRPSKTITRWRSGDVARVCALGHFVPSYLRHAAHFGFDCIWLDLEHRLIDEREVQLLLTYSHLYNIDIMLRSPTLEKTRLYRYLEDGAAGLMIPHVSTAEKAKMLVDAVKFPPIGDRGLDGAGFDSDFILAGGPQFPQEANANTFLVVQIETPEAVENVEEIAAVEGVDALFVGPGDLGLRLQHIESDLTLEKAFERVAAAARKSNKVWGCPVASAEDLQKRRDQGARLLARGGDFMALMEGLQRFAADFS